ncbi:hypothetical protein ACGFW5_06320 [Streptomyces sp. NPDC048416]|uniref:hypothetical protein n=1 Tax=Streptomyces sp. NPDC048416 TaxID=3365546 RepID=UPI003724A088
MLEDLLKKQAEHLRAEVAAHSTDHFMHRLAARAAEDARRPGRIQQLPAAAALAGPASPRSTPLPVVQLAPPPPGPATAAGGPSRPRTRRGIRRRPTPIIVHDPAVAQIAVFGYVQQLCDIVLRSNDIDTLAAFDAHYDGAGARTFACLLYTLDKRESALYWWRFAAGTGDPLAAHLLAAYHAAVGTAADARLWRVFARTLGFARDRHLPQPVRRRTELAEGFARDFPCNQEVRLFMRYPHLPRELAAR